MSALSTQTTGTVFWISDTETHPGTVLITILLKGFEKRLGNGPYFLLEKLMFFTKVKLESWFHIPDFIPIT